MSYDVNNGVKKIKVKLAIAASTVMALSGFGMAVAVPALSHAAGPVVSDHASTSACFGQARASYANPNNGLLPPGTSNGTFISERKGDNPQINAAYIADNCQ